MKNISRRKLLCLIGLLPLAGPALARKPRNRVPARLPGTDSRFAIVDGWILKRSDLADLPRDDY